MHQISKTDYKTEALYRVQLCLGRGNPLDFPSKYSPKVVEKSCIYQTLMHVSYQIPEGIERQRKFFFFQLKFRPFKKLTSESCEYIQ